MAITAVLPTTLAFPHRGELIQDAFVAAQEASQDVLAGSWTTQANLFATEANALESNVNAKEASATSAASAAAASANFQGEWSSVTAYSVGQSISYGVVIYRALLAGTNQIPSAVSSYWLPTTYHECVLQTAIASAATTNIGVVGSGDIVHVTGTNTISSLGVSTNGVYRIVVFDGVLTLTHNGISLILPSGANIITSTGDVAEFVCENGASGYWRCAGYSKANGGAIIQDVDFTKPLQGAPLFTKASVSTITIPVGTVVSVGTNVVIVKTTPYTLSLNSVAVGALDTGAKAAGTDYYVYALEAGGFIISASATNPTGYTTANSRKIGGFHYGVIPEAFTAINNITASDATKIAGINAYSLWDIKFLPANGDARGMFKANTGKWYDIYLLNIDHHLYGTSAAGKTIAGGTVLTGRGFPKIPLFYGGDGTVNYGTLTWFEAAEIGKAYGKDLISYEEFAAIAYGVLEASSAGAADTGVTQHLANYTSKFGMCMATGCQYIWGRDVGNNGLAYGWNTNTEGRGSIYGNGASPVGAIFGGYRDDPTTAGSRHSNWGNTVWNTFWHFGSRYACGHLELA